MLAPVGNLATFDSPVLGFVKGGPYSKCAVSGSKRPNLDVGTPESAL